MKRLSAVVRILTLSCCDATGLLSRSADEEVGRVDRAALRIHLLICAPCRIYRRHLALMRELVRAVLGRFERDDAAPDATLSPEGRERLRAIVAAKGG